jgi:hypothetical protein
VSFGKEQERRHGQYFFDILFVFIGQFHAL